MIMLAYAIEFLVLRRLVNQEGIVLFMSTLGVTYFLEGFGQTIWGSDIYKIDLGISKNPMFLFQSVFPGGILIDPEELAAALICAILVTVLAIFFQVTRDRTRVARGRRRSSGRAIGRHPAQLHLAGRVGDFRHRRDRRRHDLGLEAWRAVFDFAGRAQGAAGADPRGA